MCRKNKGTRIKRDKIWLILIGILIITSVFSCKRKASRSKEESKVKPQTIHEAARLGDEAVVKEFLASGVEINMKDRFGMTCLHYAAAYGQKEVAELLIANGANVNAKNPDGSGPSR